jgi:hypothetical protein
LFHLKWRSFLCSDGIKTPLFFTISPGKTPGLSVSPGGVLHPADPPVSNYDKVRRGYKEIGKHWANELALGKVTGISVLYEAFHIESGGRPRMSIYIAFSDSYSEACEEKL